MTIQDAIDAALAGDEIVVSNGVYSTGGRIEHGMLSNRVVVNKPVLVRSLNGPAQTLIAGYSIPTNVFGDAAVRCVYLTNGASLSGFTLTNGATRYDGDYPQEWNGGGVYCESPDTVVSNCVFAGNSAGSDGGGAYGGTLLNCTFLTNNSYWLGGGAESASLIDCTFTGNISVHGGGVHGSTLTNCTLVGNLTHDDSDHTSNGGGASESVLANCTLRCNSSLRGGGAADGTCINCSLAMNVATSGGGASGSTLLNCTVAGNIAAQGGGVHASTATNSIVYFNSAGTGTNCTDDSVLDHCDTFPLASSGNGNTGTDPMLVDLEHISPISLARGAGLASVASGIDIDGEAWQNPPSMGCDEFSSGSATGALSAAISPDFTNVATGFIVGFLASVTGHAASNFWSFGDGTTATNVLFLSHGWTTAGNYPVTFTVFNSDNPGGISASVTVFVLSSPVHYVSPASANPTVPFTSWATAATNIQDAVDAAFVGGTVLVTNGVYQAGSRVLSRGTTNRVAVTKPLTLQSANGAFVTVIQGGTGIRCLYLSNRVSVTGFTLRNATQTDGGAGVWCLSPDCILSDCVISNNSAPNATGGGANGGIFNRCAFSGNSGTYGAGAAGSLLNSCVLSNNYQADYGGGAYVCTVKNSLIFSNSAVYGGGLISCTVNNSLILSNSASGAGGGIYNCTANNCTIVGNYADPAGGSPASGGSIFAGQLTGCILYYNLGGNYSFNWRSFDHCCTTPDPGGVRNITDPPLFMNPGLGDFRLLSNSPCINSGYNSVVSWPKDFAGLPRIAGGTVDIGAYEYQTPSSILSYAWAQHHGFPTDGSVDYLDSDEDGMKTWQECVAGTDPNNAQSTLKMLPLPSGNNTAGISVTWQSTTGTYYFLERSSGIGAPFVRIQNDIPGNVGTTSLLDETAANSGPYFYRVGVNQ